jgi:hypothetical protein
MKSYFFPSGIVFIYVAFMSTNRLTRCIPQAWEQKSRAYNVAMTTSHWTKNYNNIAIIESTN